MDTIMNHCRILAVCCCTLSATSSEPLHAGDDPKTTLVHYMPWYSSRAVSGRWGWHWTMNHFDPEKMSQDGRREVASHYRPLIGPYDSNDPDALECHVLLMKLAGIDGVIVDWYGTRDFRDYATIHRNTRHLVRHIKKAGLRFAVCYEDQTVEHMVKGKILKTTEDVAHGTEVMEWLHENWFGDDAYLKIDRRPVMLVFGPQYFVKAQWARITSGIPERPLLFALPHLCEKAGADGAFGWVPVHGGRKIKPAVWRQYLHDLYSRGGKGESIIAPVFGRFHDIYREAGVHASHGYLDAREGKTFEETLDLAWKSSSRLIQIVTWNDYGEGTIVEPTRTDGYHYLEAIQKRVKTQPGKTLPFGPTDLRLPVKLYRLRKLRTGDPEAIESLDRASDLLFAARCEAARVLLDKHSEEDGEPDDDDGN